MAIVGINQWRRHRAAGEEMSVTKKRVSKREAQ